VGWINLRPLQKNVFVYVGYFLLEFLYECYKFLYEEKRLMLYVSECAKISRIHHASQIMDMDTIKMLDYQFIF